MGPSTNEYPSVKLDEGSKSLLGEMTMNATDTNIRDTDDVIVSSTTLFYFRILVILLGGSTSLVGIVANVINITVFLRQGIFSDRGSASLLGLAVADLCCVISMLWMCVTISLVLSEPSGLPWKPIDLIGLTAGWPHLMCAQITRMASGYVAFERCVCVVFPFKVKTIFTPARSLTIVAGMFVCCGLTYFPVFMTHQLKWIADPKTNMSRLIVVMASNSRLIIRIMLNFNNITFNLTSVAVVFVCTMITVSRVKLSKAWRESMATEDTSNPEMPHLTKKNVSTPIPQITTDPESKGGGGKRQPNQMSKSKIQKEIKLVQMIVSISVVFLICYIPDMTYIITQAINKDISTMGKYRNLADVMYSFTIIMETINSSINIFIYYRLISKFKLEFRLLFWLK